MTRVFQGTLLLLAAMAAAGCARKDEDGAIAASGHVEATGCASPRRSPGASHRWR